jgi:ribonuclease BN (tRNA processing enzyme)
MDAPERETDGHRRKMRSDRTLVPGTLALCALVSGHVPATGAERTLQAGGGQTTLTLLGTGGGPGGLASRAGIATLVTVEGRHYLVDAGDGVSRQLGAAGLSAREISAVFLTHLHDDHTAGLPGLMSFFYTTRGTNLQLIGPPGTNLLYQGVLAYLQANADIRSVQNRLPAAPAAMFHAEEVQPGLIFSDAQIKVTAVENSHYRLCAETFGNTQKSYSFKFVTPDKVIVFTGDTGDSEAVETLARKADILVSEMASPEEVASLPMQLRDHLLKEHLSPTQVGRLAGKAGVGMLLLSHIRKVSDADVAESHRYYSGHIVVGQDLARF